jgi:CTP synthase
MFCHVASNQVVGVHDVSSVYHVPLLLRSQGLVEYLQKRLDLTSIRLTKEMQDRGEGLALRWRELTKGSVSYQDLRSC